MNIMNISIAVMGKKGRRRKGREKGSLYRIFFPTLPTGTEAGPGLRVSTISDTYDLGPVYSVRGRVYERMYTRDLLNIMSFSKAVIGQKGNDYEYFYSGDGKGGVTKERPGKRGIYIEKVFPPCLKA